MIQDFHKTKAVFIFFKDVLSVDPSDHDMIDVGYALSSCDSRHADHPETVYHAGSREEKQKRNEKGRPYRSSWGRKLRAYHRVAVRCSWKPF